MSERKVVLVTGVSSGIGQAITPLPAQRGFTVFGTSRNPAESEQISDSDIDIEILPLDVYLNQSVSVKACVDSVIKRADRLDVLINNSPIHE